MLIINLVISYFITVITLEHIGIWTSDPEKLRDYYVLYLGGIANDKYNNPLTGFESYFVSFASGARLEIMSKPELKNKPASDVRSQTEMHLAFGVDNMREVDEKAAELRQAGFEIARGPRKTGDGYYEFETFDPDNNRIEVTTKYSESER